MLKPSVFIENMNNQYIFCSKKLHRRSKKIASNKRRRKDNGKIYGIILNDSGRREYLISEYIKLFDEYFEYRKNINYDVDNKNVEY